MMNTTKYSQEERAQIAKTIVEQLGGRRALFMMGAPFYVHGEEDGLVYASMRIKGTKAGNVLRIWLLASDTYHVEILRVRGTKTSMMVESIDLYDDQLKGAVEELTGLRLSL